ncbi:YbaB/EbfC family nucleoid-associated protein [Jatrophihabitans fulvus]
MQPDPAQTIDALVGRVRAAIAGDVPAAPEGPAVGEAAEGMVRAEIADDRLSSLHLDPKLLRQPLDDIAAHIVTAVNAALSQRPGPPDTGPMLEQLRAAQEQSVADMTRITQAFTDALSRAVPK